MICPIVRYKDTQRAAGHGWIKRRLHATPIESERGDTDRREFLPLASPLKQRGASASIAGENSVTTRPCQQHGLVSEYRCVAGADKTWKICCYFARHTVVSPIERWITAVIVNSCATWLMSCDRSCTILHNGNLCAFTPRKLVCLFNPELCIYISSFIHAIKCIIWTPIELAEHLSHMYVYSTICSGSYNTSQADIIMLFNYVVSAPLAHIFFY